MARQIFSWLTVLILALASPVWAGSLKIERPKAGAQLVTDASAPGGQCTAVSLEEERGAVTLALPAITTPPGLYRLSLPLQLHFQGDVHPGTLQIRMEFSVTNTVWLDCPIPPACLDATPGQWTTLSYPVTFSELSPSNSLKVSWYFKEKRPPPKKKAANEIATNAPQPLTAIDYPALLMGDPVIEPVTTTLAVEKVWPEFVHVYPGGTNPVAVTVRNFTGKPAEGFVRLQMQTGLDEKTPVGEQRVTIPANDTATVHFPWIAGARDFGYAAAATLSIGGKVVSSNTEYFSVSSPIWKTAIQGSGFITWYGREAQFPGHVAGNRRDYINVEEAFSWQPSSWTDLNPTNADWWTGQGNAHNSMSGLRQWMGLSHSNGIKMITYSWPTISGKNGFDFGQRFPELLCADDAGIAGRVSLGELHLWGVTHERPELWKFQTYAWINNMVNLGRLRAIDWHAREVIRSSRNFGWDGLRFDFPPGWSAMATNDVEREFDMLGVRDVMKQLMPEAYHTTSNVWTDAEVSARNIRYFRYLFTKELGPQFALSYNAGGLTPVETNKMASLREMTRYDGQLMNEAIRTLNAITNYMVVARWHTDAAREAGGYSCLFKAEACRAPLGSIYSAIFTFALGSHPYQDYGWTLMPGAYTQFMTRYGEYCWDLALTPVAPEKAGVTVESKTPLLWEDYIRQRETNGVLQTVQHLITKPELDPAKSLVQSQVEWPRGVVANKKCRSEPTVWLLTPEPELTATKLTVERHGDHYSVTVPSMHFWSTLVWSEKP